MTPSTRVATFLPNLDYIRLKRGEYGEKLVINELLKRGYNYDFRHMDKMAWVPIKVRKEFMQILNEELGWGNDKIYDMGYFAPQKSPIMKFFFGLFLSVNTAFSNAPKMWEKHYNIGRLEVPEMGKNRAIMVLKNVDIHPLYCEYLRGYFAGTTELVRGVKSAHVEENKCTFRGDEHHEYVVTWNE